jgi:5'-3' exonuclease
MIVDKSIVIFDATCLLYIHGNKEDYETTIHNHLKEVLKNCNTTYYIGILDGKTNFRRQVAVTKEYKGQRKAEKPLYFYQIRKLLIEKYNFIIVDGIEADDLAVILSERINNSLIKEDDFISHKFDNYKAIIASIDKDLPQADGIHYNLKNHQQTIVSDDNSYIMLNDKKKIDAIGYKSLYVQMLMGDAADNIPGLPKYGPVKAYDLLKDCNTRDECKQVVIEEYKKVYPSDYEDRIKENFSLVYILRNHDDVGDIKIRDFNHVSI